MAEFREILKELRNSHQPEKITQKQLAKAINVSHSTISAYERGTRIPTLDNLSAFADFFGVSIDFLSGRSKYSVPFSQLSSCFVSSFTYEDLLKAASELLPDQRQALILIIRNMGIVASISKHR